jgi:hypothetical protein
MKPIIPVPKTCLVVRNERGKVLERKLEEKEAEGQERC